MSSATAAATARLPTYRAIVERLGALKPVSLTVTNDSAAHAGHSGNPDGAADAETHFNVEVISDKFDGLRLIQRHRLIYESLGDLMETIHALSIKAKTPEESGAQ